MGLDIAEIIMDLEEAFGVPLEWNGRVRTVGDLQQAMADAVTRAATLSEAQARECYIREITAALGIGPADLDRSILDVVPDLPKRLPDLAVTSWWTVGSRMGRPTGVIVALWSVTPVSMIALWLASPQDHSVVIAGLIFGPMLTALLAYATDGWRTRLPAISSTTAGMLVQEAVQRFLHQNPDVVSGWVRGGTLLRAELDAKVLEIVAGRGGLKPERIKPSDRLVEDLGLG